MKNTLLSLTSLVLLAAFAAPVQAQTLAEAAKREAERRAKLTEPVKVITNADLEALPSRGGAAPATPARPEAVLPPPGAAAPATEIDEAAAPEPDAQAPAAATARLKRDEQHWRERAQLLRERLDRLQSDAAALQSRVQVLNADIDAASGSERTALAGELRLVSASLVQAQEKLRLMQGEWRQFEARAAQAKIPPAWIR